VFELTKGIPKDLYLSLSALYAQRRTCSTKQKGLSQETFKVEKRTLARGLEYRRSSDERAEILTAFVHFKNDF
jgi:hypothetical protein